MEVIAASVPGSHLDVPAAPGDVLVGRRSRSRSGRVVTGIEDLPFEILDIVAQYLKPLDLRNAVQVCRFWLTCLSPFVFSTLHVQTVRSEPLQDMVLNHKPVQFVPRLHEHNHPTRTPRGGWYTSLIRYLTLDVKEFCCERCLQAESHGMFEFIRLCPNLQSIRLQHSGVIGTPDLSAPFLPSGLERLSITRWRLEYLSLPRSLRELTLNQCYVVDILSQLKRMDNLRSLTMVRCWPRWSRESILLLLEQNGAGLESLTLKDDYGERWIGAIDDTVLGDIARCCPRLRQLSIASVMISDIGIARLADSGMQLERLDLEAGSGEGRPGVTDISLITAFAAWPKLRFLRLVYVDITGEALGILAQVAHHLEHLEIHLLGGLKLLDFAVLKSLSSLKKVAFKSFFAPIDFSEQAKLELTKALPFEMVLDI